MTKGTCALPPTMDIEAMAKEKFQKYKSDWSYPLYNRRAYMPGSPYKGRCVTFQAALRALLVVGQCFGLMPVIGIWNDDASKLRFTLKSWRCFYALVTIFFLSGLVVFCFLKTIKETDSSLGSNTSLIFHIMTCITAILFFRLAMQWPRLCLHISKTEASDPNMDYGLIKRCNYACAIILLLALFEHSLADLYGISLARDCDPEIELFESYIYHSFPWIFKYIQYNTFYGIVVVFLNLQGTFNWNFADVFVICMSLYLASRLEQVNQRIVAVKGKYVPSSFWRTMREDYNRVSNLVRNVDEIIGGIIFISFANNLFFICLQLLHTLAPLKGYEQAVYFAYSFIFLMVRSLAVSLTAASVHTASKAPAVSLYHVSSTTYCVEIQRFLEQIHGDTVALSGLRFFHVKRGLVLAVSDSLRKGDRTLIHVGASVTLCVIILINHPLYNRRAYMPGSPYKGRCVTFQAALRALLVVGQCFGLMPVIGIWNDDASKLRFTLKSWRCFYALVTIFFLSGLVVFCFLKTIKETDSSLGSNTSLIFHIMTCITAILFFRLAMQWPRLCLHISKTEASDPNMDYGLIKRCNYACAIILLLALFEHSLADLYGISLARDCDPEIELFESYIYHSFPWIFKYIQYNTFYGIVVVFLNLQGTFNWNFADVFVICMSLYLASRLEQVNQRIVAVKGKYVPSSFWRTMREDYNRVSNLVRNVDEIIGGIIFISFANNLFFICLQLLHTLAPLKGYEQAVYFAYSFIFLMVRSLAVSLTAASVHTASKAPAVSLYHVSSTTYCVEIQRFLEQIHGDTVALSGLRFFHVKRGLVLAIAGTIVTYELVLMQFTGVSPTSATPV